MSKLRRKIMEMYDNPDDIPVSVWPMCNVNGCCNRVCLSISEENTKCFPHSASKDSLMRLLRTSKRHGKKYIKQ